MSLKANVTHDGDITILEIQGKLNFDNQDELRENIMQIMRNGKNLVVDLNGLDFIGSSGVTAFVQMVRNFGTEFGRIPRFCNVSREFRKIMNAFDIHRELIFESRSEASKDFFRTGENERN